MSKRWLYSVAVGALLIVGEAMGVTVQDVLSNDFWSPSHRGTAAYMASLTEKEHVLPHSKTLMYKDRTKSDGTGKFACADVSYASMGKIKWRNTNYLHTNIVKEQESFILYIRDKYKIKAVREAHKEKHKITRVATLLQDEKQWGQNSDENITTVYKDKIRQPDGKPIKPFVLENWFTEQMTNSWFLNGQLYETKDVAITNVVSDNEAYITRTIHQSGYLYDWMGYPVNEDAFVLSTYTTHITTDEDHVYVTQDITEKFKNEFICVTDGENNYTTEYVATRKKGRWKTAQETITQTLKSETCPWYYDYKKSEASNTSVTKVSRAQDRLAQAKRVNAPEQYVHE